MTDSYKNQIFLVKIEELIPYTRNARTHSDAQVAQIAASIKEFGWTNPVLIDGEKGIIAGHGRVLAARKLGMSEVPCIVLSHLTQSQKRAYILADNKLAENAGWDLELLKIELGELDEDEFDLSLTGFEDAEIDALLGDYAASEDISQTQDADEQDAADDVPDAPAVAVSRLGDVWAIGAHRLICGDATDQAVVAALMQGDTARLCFTSPPYGNQRNYTSGGIADWDGLMRGVFSHLPMAEDGQVLVNLGLIHRENEVIPYWDDWLVWMRTQGWRRFAWYVWDQGVGLPGDWVGRLAPSFEFIFHFNRKSRHPNKIVPCKYAGEVQHSKSGTGGLRRKDGDINVWTHEGEPIQITRIPDSVIRITRQKGSIGKDIDHPAVFPVALPEFIINSYTNTGDIVFEPFNGSGTTILASQRTGRICRSVEISPAYVDVAIKRFKQNYPSIPITLMSTGQSFEHVSVDRGATSEITGKEARLEETGQKFPT